MAFFIKKKMVLNLSLFLEEKKKYSCLQRVRGQEVAISRRLGSLQLGRPQVNQNLYTRNRKDVVALKMCWSSW